MALTLCPNCRLPVNNSADNCPLCAAPLTRSAVTDESPRATALRLPLVPMAAAVAVLATLAMLTRRRA